MLTDETIKTWQEQARRDDACNLFVPSDIRQMLGEIVRLREQLNAPPKVARAGKPYG